MDILSPMLTKSLWRTVLVFMGLFVVLQAAPADVALIKEGKPVAKIFVHPDDLNEVERIQHYRDRKFPSEVGVALEDLNYHLEAMSGAKLEIVEVSDPTSIEGPAVVLGRLASEAGAKPKTTEFGESYRILVKGDRVLIGGERPLASSYAVYDLLNTLGVDWVMPGRLGEVIPKSPSVVIPETDRTEIPDFALRHMWIGGHPKHFAEGVPEEYQQWLTRQRMGTTEMHRARLNEAHMWNKLVLKYKEEFEKNPEMLALVTQPDGTQKREGPQIETTHPGAIELGARYIRETFEEKGWPGDKEITLAIGPADGLGYSESSESLTIAPPFFDPITGYRDTTDLVVKYANDVLELIGDEFPNLTLSYYVYSTHNRFPFVVKPNPRVWPIFAPIGYSRLHSTVDPHSKTRAHYRQIVEQWSEHAEKYGVPLMVYEYNWNLADNMLPFTRIRSFPEDLQFYKQNGFFGVTVESQQAWAATAPHNFIIGKMLWDTSQDWEDLLKNFCEKSFGPAASFMERYYLRLAETQRTAGLEAGSYYSAPLIFDAEFMRASREDIDAALATPGLSDLQRDRIRAMEFGFRSLELYLAWNAASNEFNFENAMKIGEQMRQNYQAAIDFNPHLYGRPGGIYIDRLLLKSTEGSLTYSSAPYRIIHRLPDELPTLFDQHNEGEQMNLFGTKVNDEGWIKTKTYSSTLDAQGLGFLRPGAIWYRTRFEVPADLKGEGVGLFLGAFEDVARVWVNGVFIGSSGVVFPQPAVFDLTDAILFGEKNLITIEIDRYSLANELLIGGIFRPSFVFAGPRVETPEPAPVRYRVLPGGETEPIMD